jgi:Ca2+-binding EF-hand superfamily protein
VGLRCISAGNIFTDTSRNFVGAEDEDAHGSRYPHTALSAYEALRYLNCDMFFSERSLNVLIRALHHTSKRQRKIFFKNILMCRRRLSKKWSTSPVAKIFTLADQFAMLKQRALSACMSSAIKRKGMLLYDAFCKFDFGHNGYLTPGEVWGGFDFLQIAVGAQDVLDFVNAADTDNDGLLSFREFVDILQDPDKAAVSDSDGSGSGVYSPEATPRALRTPSEMAGGEGEGEEDLPLDSPVMQRQVSLTPVAPRGEEELRALQAQQRAQEQEDESEAESEEEARERKIREELEVGPLTCLCSVRHLMGWLVEDVC